MSRSAIEIVQGIHDGSRPMRTALIEQISDGAEFHAPGDPAILPWAGTFRGPSGVRRQSELLGAHVKYEQFGPHEYFLSEDGREVAVRSATRVRGLATDRVFESSFLRVFSFDGGQITDVRTWYDTLAYALAIGAVAESSGVREAGRT